MWTNCKTDESAEQNCTHFICVWKWMKTFAFFAPPPTLILGLLHCSNINLPRPLAPPLCFCNIGVERKIKVSEGENEMKMSSLSVCVSACVRECVLVCVCARACLFVCVCGVVCESRCVTSHSCTQWHAPFYLTFSTQQTPRESKDRFK